MFANTAPAFLATDRRSKKGFLLVHRLFGTSGESSSLSLPSSSQLAFAFFSYLVVTACLPFGAFTVRPSANRTMSRRVPLRPPSPRRGGGTLFMPSRWESLRPSPPCTTNGSSSRKKRRCVATRERKRKKQERGETIGRAAPRKESSFADNRG